MSLQEQNIVIQPNVGVSNTSPKITFSGADASTNAKNITINMYPTSNGTLSFEGNTGQLFSITDSMSGTIFSVNDISGIPSIEVLDTGLVKLAEYSGNVAIGKTTANYKLDVQGDSNVSGTYKIANTTVLSSSALGSGITSSSLTSVGTITSGTWSGSFGAVSGANLTTLNASNLASGTVPDARISGSYTGMTNLTGSGTVDFATFLGNAADTVTTPSFSWTGDTSNGIYRPAANNIAFTTNGVERLRANSTGIYASVAYYGSGTGLTSLPAGQLSGTIPSAVLGNSTLYVGTTTIALNRASLSQTLTGVSIDGNAATVTNGVYTSRTISTTSPLSGGGDLSANRTLSLASNYGDTQNPYASKTANHFLAAPNGTAGVPTFRAIVAADIPTLNQNTTGSAATLTTTRTLWGQNFNGSGNVTGNLTSVGDITGTSTLGLYSTTTNALNIDSGTTGAINIGTNANAKTITLGNVTGATSFVVNSGTSGVTFNQVAAGIFKIQASAAPTTDMVQITNAGQAITTAGTNSLEVTFVGGAAAVEAGAIRTGFTPGTTTGGTWNGFRIVPTAAANTGVIMNGMKFDDITAGTGTDNMIYAGTGWDNIINYNGTSIINGSGQINASQLLTGTVPGDRGVTSGSTTPSFVEYNGTTATAGQFDGGTTTPTGTTRLNYGGYFYPTFINLIGSADTTTTATHYFVETGSDGYVRPKTLVNVKTELLGNQYITFSGPAAARTYTLPDASGTILTSTNYNSYSPTLTGGGASGTWGINVTGNAATLTTARTLTIGSTGKTFNGSADVSWSLAEIGAYAASNPSGYTSNAGTVTSVSGTGTVGGLSLSGTVTSSGSLTLSGTVSVNFNDLTNKGSGTGTYTTSGDYRAPIFYDSNNTAYYVDPNSTSSILNLTLNGTQNFPSGGGGATFSSGHYSMGKDVANGSWSHPHYADLIIGYHTGIRLGAAYSGIRFYNNSPTTDANNDGNGDGGEALLMTIGGHAGGTGVIVNNTLTAGADARAPIFYDHNDTGYYVDPNSTGTSAYLAGALYVGMGVNNSNIYMGDTDEGTRRIHCNSNRIGFLNSSDGWGSFCDDAGWWQSDSSVRTPIYYDSNDTYYYNDLNSSRRFAGRTYIHEWIEFVNYTGLYSPNNAAHFYPNLNSYGSWRCDGSRNGWQGIEFSAQTTLMMNDDTYGFHRNTGGDWRLYVTGSNLYVKGLVTAYWSDRRLKENLRPIDQEANSILSKLTAYRFNWNDKVQQFMTDLKPGKEEIGLIAQEVQSVLPDAVVTNKCGNKINPDGTQEESDYLTINWNKITPIIIQALNNTTKELNELKQLLKIKEII